MRLHRINAVIMRHLYLFPRTLERWAESIYWPVIDLVVWGLTSKWVETAGSNVPQLALILLTGVVFWQVVWRANYEISVNLLEEFWNQNMVNLFATPLIGLGMVGRPGGAGLDQERADAGRRCRGGVAALPAEHLRGRLDDAAVPVLALDLGLVHGLCRRGRDRLLRRKVQSIAWIAGFALAPFSAVYYPVEILPGWARAIASALPMTYIFEGMRKVLRGGPMPLQELAAKLRAELPVPRLGHRLLRLDVRPQPGERLGEAGLDSSFPD